MMRARESLAFIFRAQLDALTFRPAPSVPINPSLFVLFIHLLGLSAAFRYFNLPIWYALLTLTVLLILLIVLSRITHHQSPSQAIYPTTQLPNYLTLLAPLFVLYAILAARFIYVRAFGGLVPGYFDDVPPQPHAALFQIEPIATAVLVYLFTCLLVSFLRSRASMTLATLLTVASYAWAGAEYIGQRARGVTGSDPYAYVQMGVDLATRGTPLHRFSLFAEKYQLPLAWFPFVHVGYHLPTPPVGDAATVWSFGGSLAYALAFRVLGEEGMYWVNPVFSLLVLAAIALLAREIFYGGNATRRAWIIALSIFLWATSSAVVAWAVVPMVDAQATLLSILAFYFAVRWARQPRDWFAVASGLCLGIAYFVRHTQVLLAPAIAFLMLANQLPRSLRWRALFLAGFAALAVALPDLYYHQTVFGSWLTPESLELNLFSSSAVSQTLFAFADRFFAAYEFGWLAPFLLYGAYRMARDHRTIFSSLVIWFFVIFIFHLFYPALRLRDLLPEFPPIILFTAYGIVALIGTLLRGERGRQKFAATFALFLALWLPTLRVWNTLRLPFQPPRALFGYLTAPQRAAFDELARLTPARAVIGSTLNSGAIDLYARRDAFRPVDWNATERAVFIRAIGREGRAVFVLNDGTGIGSAIEELKRDFGARRIAVLDVPLFGAVEGEAGALWKIFP